MCALRLELSTDRSDTPPELTPDIKRALVAVLRRDCLGEKRYVAIGQLFAC